MWMVVYFNDDLSRKTCYAEEYQDVMQIVPHITHEQVKHNKDIVNVTGHFDYLTVSYLMQSLLMLGCALYQLAAIMFCKDLLRYRMYVSRINKILMVYLLWVIFWTHVYRLSDAGKLCAGDDLSHAQREDPILRSNYLIEVGTILKGYLILSWVCCSALVLGCVLLVIMLHFVL